MATIATATPGKTSFVKQFLNDHPDGTTKTVNEAWQAAGMKGTISHPIISQVRKKLVLPGVAVAVVAIVESPRWFGCRPVSTERKNAVYGQRNSHQFQGRVGSSLG